MRRCVADCTVSKYIIPLPCSMVLQIIRADILRVALHFSEPQRGEKKIRASIIYKTIG